MKEKNAVGKHSSEPGIKVTRNFVNNEFIIRIPIEYGRISK